jgi:hydrogenase nickel incorporation protein HypA/HybF
MHELALISEMIDMVLARVESRRVALVRVEIGALAGVQDDALRFAFEVCTQNTALAGAALDIVTIEARSQCASCHRVTSIRSLIEACACGSFDRELLAGDELRLKEVEVY